MAQASITMGNYSIMEGRALARTGAVTFNGSSGNLPPSTIIKANGAMGNVTVNYPATVSVTVEMYAGADAGMNADWWIVAIANSSWYYLNN